MIVPSRAVGAAPSFLTNPQPDELFLAGAFALGGSLATNAIIKADTFERKGVLMMVSGLSVIAVMAFVNYLCDGSRQGICAHVPQTTWE